MSIGTRLWTWWAGEPVGTDQFGNRYYRQKNFRVRERGAGKFSRERRWVIYNGQAEASRVPPAWHGWLHHTVKDPPRPEDVQKKYPWQKEHLPNLTGTVYAYHPQRPAGAGDRRLRALAAGVRRGR